MFNGKNNQENAGKNEASRIDNQASIKVVVTPVDISPKSKEWKFSIVMDTHSIELNQDLIKTSILVDEQGQEYKPLRWDGPIGGHHREGVLVFNRMVSDSKTIELKISDGGTVRSFIWKH